MKQRNQASVLLGPGELVSSDGFVCLTTVHLSPCRRWENEGVDALKVWSKVIFGAALRNSGASLIGQNGCKERG